MSYSLCGVISEMTIQSKSSQPFDHLSETWTGGLHRVLCMQGGDDDFSYAKNSHGPASAITLSKPILLAAIQSMKLFFLNNSHFDSDSDSSLRIADLGCATGSNTLATIEIVVDALRKRYVEEIGIEPEIEAFFSDLPCNDFNTLFKSLCGNNKTRDNNSNYYAAGVPGSFYRRLFPKKKLHVAVSLSALHWLSQIPEEVVDAKSAAWNKGRAWIDGGKREVVEAYAKQSEKDIDEFLKCRKEEIIKGGILFILMAGRPENQASQNQLDDEDSRAKHPFTNSMDQAWQDLLDEGLIDEDTRDGFNIPAYMRSVDEVEKAINKCGGFQIQSIEYKKLMEHSQDEQQKWIKDPISYGRAKANIVRATLKPIVEAHVGPYLSAKLFKRFENKVSSDTALLRKTCFYGVIVVCAIRM